MVRRPTKITPKIIKQPDRFKWSENGTNYTNNTDKFIVILAIDIVPLVNHPQGKDAVGSNLAWIENSKGQVVQPIIVESSISSGAAPPDSNTTTLFTFSRGTILPPNYTIKTPIAVRFTQISCNTLDDALLIA
jgi:hypothetical protein